MIPVFFHLYKDNKWHKRFEIHITLSGAKLYFYYNINIIYIEVEYLNSSAFHTMYAYICQGLLKVIFILGSHKQ